MPDDTRSSLPLSAAVTGTSARAYADLPRKPFPFLMRYVRHGFGGHVALIMLLYGASTGADALQTYVLGRLVNTLALATDTSNPVVWFAALCGTWLMSYMLAHAYTLTAYATHAAMRARIHDDLFAYLLDHAPRYFLDQASGALAHKIRVAASSGVVVVDHLSAHTARLTILFAVTGTMIARTAPDMLWVSAAFLIAFTSLAAWFAQRLRRLAKAGSAAASAQSARMGDAASNWDLVRSFAARLYERASLQPFNDREAATFMDLRVAAIAMRVVLHTLSFAFLAWLAWGALGAARAGTITVGAFTTLVMLFILVAANIRSFGDTLFSYFENLGMVTEALDVVLAPHEIVDVPGATALQVAGGAITIQGIDFAYADGTPVFENFSLNVAAGERVGLVGASGAGKSTLIKLMRRQFPLRRGRILVDGQDIATVTWDSVHEAFGEVPQTPGMFHRTVRENIAYGKPDAGEDEIIAAAKAAHCHDFIAMRAKGYDSVVGEKGMKLSGGERQRVAIARAFLKNAPILLLDEATSSLDSEAEHLIQEALLTLMAGRTVIAIAHRLSTIMHLDRILVLEDGKIIEEGSHAALLARGGAYARLWAHQAGGFM